MQRSDTNGIQGVIFGGAMLGFCLADFKLFNFSTWYCPAVPAIDGSTGSPNQCYWYTNSETFQIGIKIHIAACLPAGFLAVFQFVPAIRHRWILYHRIMGYIIFALVLIMHAGSIMLSTGVDEVDLPTQAFVGLVDTITVITFSLAIYNVKKQQLDQHRAWMLRTWFYLAFIITMRIIQIMIAEIISLSTSYTRYITMSCDELLYLEGVGGNNASTVYAQYPACRPDNIASMTTDGKIAVKGHMTAGFAQTTSALQLSFATAGAFALILHAAGVEIYLRLTPREAERLRMVSYQRQMERGYKNPGSAGLVVEKIGDADPWVPKTTSTVDVQEIGHKTDSSSNSGHTPSETS
jgi:uncharacterized membrane protein